MYNLEGKVALVTGAAGAGGLGRAIALRLAAEGADLLVNDLSEDSARRQGLPDLVGDIEAMGRRALPVYADVSSADDVERMVERGLAAYGKIDILVNNAGAPAGRDRVPVVELEEAAFDLVQRVNLKGVYLCSRAVALAMLSHGQGGRIINIASTAGKRGVARYAAYCASKFAVIGFTQAMALELGGNGITVNAICPGLVATERIDDMAAVLAPEGISASQHRQRMIESSIAGTALGRMTEADDVAGMAAFLASEQAAFLTGCSYTVDGGAVLH